MSDRLNRVACGSGTWWLDAAPRAGSWPVRAQHPSEGLPRRAARMLRTVDMPDERSARGVALTRGDGRAAYNGAAAGVHRLRAAAGPPVACPQPTSDAFVRIPHRSRGEISGTCDGDHRQRDSADVAMQGPVGLPYGACMAGTPATGDERTAPSSRPCTPDHRRVKFGLVLLVGARGCIAVNQDAEPAVVIYPRRAAGARWEEIPGRGSVRHTRFEPRVTLQHRFGLDAEQLGRIMRHDDESVYGRRLSAESARSHENTLGARSTDVRSTIGLSWSPLVAATRPDPLPAAPKGQPHSAVGGSPMISSTGRLGVGGRGFSCAHPMRSTTCGESVPPSTSSCNVSRVDPTSSG